VWYVNLTHILLELIKHNVKAAQVMLFVMVDQRYLLLKGFGNNQMQLKTFISVCIQKHACKIII
jgi:hypothetical protein